MTKYKTFKSHRNARRFLNLMSVYGLAWYVDMDCRTVGWHETGGVEK